MRLHLMKNRADGRPSMHEGAHHVSQRQRNSSSSCTDGSNDHWQRLPGHRARRPMTCSIDSDPSGRGMPSSCESRHTTPLVALKPADITPDLWVASLGGVREEASQTGDHFGVAREEFPRGGPAFYVEGRKPADQAKTHPPLDSKIGVQRSDLSVET